MTLSDTDIKNFKDLLLKEKEHLIGELDTVGSRNPNDPEDWEVKTDEMETMQADRNEVADRNEETVDNAGILNELEIRYNRVKRALGKIDSGTYGRCEVSGEPIPKERLEANPAALTTIEHETKLHQ